MPCYDFLILENFSITQFHVLPKKLEILLKRNSSDSSDGRCVQKTGTFSVCYDETHLHEIPIS